MQEINKYIERLLLGGLKHAKSLNPWLSSSSIRFDVSGALGCRYLQILFSSVFFYSFGSKFSLSLHLFLFIFSPPLSHLFNSAGPSSIQVFDLNVSRLPL